MSDTNHLQHFRSMEGKAYQLGPLKLAFKRNDVDGEGSYSMFESLEVPGGSVALHRHPTFQETFIVLARTAESARGGGMVHDPPVAFDGTAPLAA